MKKSPKNFPDSTESSSLSLELLQKLATGEEKLPPMKKVGRPPKPKNTSDIPATHALTVLKSENVGSFLESRKTKSALESFEDAVGGRQTLIDTISMANLDKKQEHFLRILCDPARSRDNLATICRDTGMVPSQVIDLFRTASFAKAHAIGMGVISEAVPAIMKDIAEKSVDAEVICPSCLGNDNPLGVCQRCNGAGRVLRESDIDRQKIALEVSGMLKKGGGVNVQVNQQVNTVGASSFFSKYVKSSDECAYDVGEVIDVTPKNE